MQCPYCRHKNDVPREAQLCPQCGRPVCFTGGQDFTEVIVDRTRDFTGREWVFAKIDAWLADPNSPRAFFLSGGPGSGKSAVAARLVQLIRGEEVATACPHLLRTGLAYFHFCQAQFNAVVEPVGFVKSLSLALAGRYPSFARALTQIGQRHPEIHVQQTVGLATASEITAVKISTLEVGGLSARKAFAHLVAEPLETLAQSGETGAILILVDALDEALPFDQDDNLVTLLANVTDDPRDLPRQVHFLVTGRPDPRVLDLIGKPALDLIDDAPNSQRDVQAYAEHRLAPMLAEPAARNDLAERIAATGAGNFLYARYVVDDLLRHPEDPATLSLPAGLDDVYVTFLKRELGRQGRTWRTYRPLLGALVMARGSGLMRQHLAGIMQERASTVEDLLEPCMQYLEGAFPDGPFRIYHQSFRDFLLASGQYRLEPDEVRNDIARYFWTQYAAFRDNRASLDDYTLAYTVYHLTEAIRAAEGEHTRRELHERLCALLTDFEFLETKADRIGTDALLADIRAATAMIASAELSALEKVLDREIINLDRWKSGPSSAFFAQQIFNRATAFGFEALAQRASERLTKLGAPYLEAMWRISNESSALQRRLGGHEGSVGTIALTADSASVLFVAPEDVLHIWNLDTGEKQQIRSSQTGRSAGPAAGLALSTDGTLAFTMGNLGLRVWNLRDLKEVWAGLNGQPRGLISLVPETEHGTAVDLVLHEPYLGGSVGTLDFSTGVYEERGAFKAPDVTALALTPDGRQAIIARGEFGIVSTWDLRTFEKDDLPCEHRGTVRALAVTHDGTCLISGADDGILRVWDLISGELIRPLKGHRYAVSTVAVTPNGKRAITGSWDHTVRVWDLDAGQQIAILYGHDDAVSNVLVTSDFERAISSDLGGQLILWNLARLDIARTQAFSTHTYVVNEIKTVPGGLRAVTASNDGTLGVWDLVARKQERILGAGEPSSGMLSVAVFQDGRHVVSGDVTGNITIWDLVTGQKRCSGHGHRGAVWMVAVATDGNVVVSASSDGTVKIWRVVYNDEEWSLQHIRNLDGHNDEVTGVAVAEADAADCVASKDRSVRLWDFDTGEPLGKMLDHEAAVLSVVTTPNGLTAISSAENGSLCIWELATGSVRALAGHTNPTWGLAVSPSGKRLASASWDNTFKIWNLETGREIAMMAIDVRAVCVSFATETTVVVGDLLGSVGCLQLSGIDG